MSDRSSWCLVFSINSAHFHEVDKCREVTKLDQIFCDFVNNSIYKNKITLEETFIMIKLSQVLRIHVLDVEI